MEANSSDVRLRARFVYFVGVTTSSRESLSSGAHRDHRAISKFLQSCYVRWFLLAATLLMIDEDP